MNNNPAEEYFEKGMEMYKSERYFAAAKYWKEAAQYGHATAMYNIGILYLNGQGVSQDGGEAFDYFIKAADEGDNDAVYQIGRCFEFGIGVAKDLSKACEAYEVAADEGHEKAKERLEILRPIKASSSNDNPFASDDILSDMYNSWVEKGMPEAPVNWSYEKVEEWESRFSNGLLEGSGNRNTQQSTTNSPTKQSASIDPAAEKIARMGFNYLFGTHVEKN
jgi:TPR repeat protein